MSGYEKAKSLAFAGCWYLTKLDFFSLFEELAHHHLLFLLTEKKTRMGFSPI